MGGNCLSHSGEDWLLSNASLLVSYRGTLRRAQSVESFFFSRIILFFPLREHRLEGYNQVVI